MIKVIANNYVKAECVEEYLSIAKELVEKTNANDAGCIKYELCKNVGDPTHFVMTEEWQDQASLDAHMKAPHFTGLIPKMGGLTKEPTTGMPPIMILEKVF